MMCKTAPIILLLTSISLLFIQCDGDMTSEMSENIQETLFTQATELKATDPDSASLLFQDIYFISIDKGYDSLAYAAAINIASVYTMRGALNMAIEYHFKALSLLDDHPHIMGTTDAAKMRISILSAIAGSYYELQNRDLALNYYLEVLKVLEEADRSFQDSFPGNYKYYILYNIGSVYLAGEETEQAEAYFRRAENEAGEEADSLLKAGLLSNYGIILKNRGEPDLAMQNYLQALEIRERLGDRRGVVSSLNNIGDYYLLIKDYPNAISYFERSKREAEEINAYTSQQMAFDRLAVIYAETGDYKRAFENLIASKQLSDTLFYGKQQDQVTQQALNYQIEADVRQREFEYRMEVSKARNSRIVFMLTSGFFLLLAGLLGLLFVLQRSRTKRIALLEEKARLQHEIVTKDRQILKEDLDNKNRMLTTDILRTAQQNEFIIKLFDRLHKYVHGSSDADHDELRALLSDFQNTSNNSFWKEFEKRFGDVHQDFYNNLHERFPDLTPSERRLAGFMKLNLTTKEIAAIAHQTPDSVKVGRSRLRKKLGMRAEENLIGFLQGL